LKPSSPLTSPSAYTTGVCKLDVPIWHIKFARRRRKLPWVFTEHGTQRFKVPIWHLKKAQEEGSTD